MYRVVKINIQTEKVNDFLQIFDEISKEIRHFSGCSSLRLMRDKHQPNIFFTFSEWTAESDLETYRNSELFRENWKELKKYFQEKPSAWSLESIRNLHL